MDEDEPGDEPAPAAARKRSPAVEVARIAFFVLIVALLVRVGVRNASQLRDVSLEVSPLWFLAAAPFTFLGGLLLPLAWRRLLIAYGVTLPLGPTLRVWCLSQASRYIPTGVAMLASRVVLAGREGVSRSLAGASLVLEVGVIVCWGAVFTGVCLPSSTLPLPVRVLVGAGAAVVLVALPRVLHQAGRRIRRLPASLKSSSLRVGALYEAIALYGANSAVKSLGFVLFAAALLPVHGSDVWLLVGAVNAAAIIGMIGITPGGIGVREGVLAALLRDRFGLGDAAAMAIALRAWDFSFELLWLAVASLATRARRATPQPG